MLAGILCLKLSASYSGSFLGHECHLSCCFSLGVLYSCTSTCTSRPTCVRQGPQPDWKIWTARKSGEKCSFSDESSVELHVHSAANIVDNPQGHLHGRHALHPGDRSTVWRWKYYGLQVTNTVPGRSVKVDGQSLIVPESINRSYCLPVHSQLLRGVRFFNRMRSDHCHTSGSTMKFAFRGKKIKVTSGMASTVYLKTMLILILCLITGEE